MAALQASLPSPAPIPRRYNVRVTDLQDCPFSIPPAPAERKRFAFSLLSVNLKQPYRCFHWKVLPQGMKNSPTLCQEFVDLALTKVRLSYLDVYLIHYVDDIFLAHSDQAFLQDVF